MKAEHLKTLLNFQQEATLDDFKTIFNERVGEHLWFKYTRSLNYNLLLLWHNMSESHRIQLQDHLNGLIEEDQVFELVKQRETENGYR